MNSTTPTTIAAGSCSSYAIAKLGAALAQQMMVQRMRRRRMTGMGARASSRERKRRSRPFARHDLVLLALADAAQRVVLAQRVAAVAVPREDAAEVRVPDEDDAVHVVDF